jgi:hypothetical protein
VYIIVCTRTAVRSGILGGTTLSEKDTESRWSSGHTDPPCFGSACLVRNSGDFEWSTDQYIEVPATFVCVLTPRVLLPPNGRNHDVTAHEESDTLAKLDFDKYGVLQGGPLALVHAVCMKTKTLRFFLVPLNAVTPFYCGDGQPRSAVSSRSAAEVGNLVRLALLKAVMKQQLMAFQKKFGAFTRLHPLLSEYLQVVYRGGHDHSLSTPNAIPPRHSPLTMDGESW